MISFARLVRCLLLSAMSFQSVHAGDKNILHPAILELGKYPQPELRAFGLCYPQPQHFLLPLQVHAQHHVDL